MDQGRLHCSAHPVVVGAAALLPVGAAQPLVAEEVMAVAATLRCMN